MNVVGNQVKVNCHSQSDLVADRFGEVGTVVAAAPTTLYGKPVVFVRVVFADGKDQLFSADNVVALNG